MSAVSKLLPPHVARAECRQILHPWTDNCFLAFLGMYASSCFGSAGYFALLYLFQYLVKAFKGKKQSMLKELLLMYLRTCVVFASSVASFYIGTSCFLRKVLGRFYYYTIVLIPATLSGFAIASEMPRNKDFFAVTFANQALESWINRLKESGKLRWSRRGQTVVFMFLAAAVSFLYSKTQNENQYFWFFVPPKVTKSEGNEERNSCFHRDSCRRHIFTSFTKYFTTGFFLKLLKLLFSHFKKPKTIFLSLFKPKMYTLASFLGFYALVYQTCRCYLFQRDGSYSALHEVVSGFLSGAAYGFEPNISIFNSAIITIVQILTEIGIRMKVVPDFYFRETVFAVSSGILFHCRFYAPRHLPSLMQYMMTSITHRNADYIVSNYEKLLGKV